MSTCSKIAIEISPTYSLSSPCPLDTKHCYVTPGSFASMHILFADDASYWMLHFLGNVFIVYFRICLGRFRQCITEQDPSYYVLTRKQR